MDLYYNHIVDLLVNNIGIKQLELYKISGIESKREFLTTINRLVADHRIIKQFDHEYIRSRYSPKVLYLWECEKSSDTSIKDYRINFIPTAVLEKELEYVNNGTEQEDCLEFELQITGFQINKKYKSYFENHTGLVLDFDKYKYYLWAQFLDPFPN